MVNGQLSATYVVSAMPKGIYDRSWLRGHTYETRETKCPKCNTKVQSKRKDTFCQSCKDINLKQHWKKVEQKRDLAKRRNEVLKRNFGISLEEYGNMLKEQDYQCIICKKQSVDCGRALDVDHNHKTGKIRGLLCNQCNQALGLFKDNVKFLENAIKYLGKHNA